MTILAGRVEELDEMPVEKVSWSLLQKCKKVFKHTLTPCSPTACVGPGELFLVSSKPLPFLKEFPSTPSKAEGKPVHL